MAPFQWLSDGLPLSSSVGKNDCSKGWETGGPECTQPGLGRTEGSLAWGLGAQRRLRYFHKHPEAIICTLEICFCFFTDTFFSLEYLLCFLLKT